MAGARAAPVKRGPPRGAWKLLGVVVLSALAALGLSEVGGGATASVAAATGTGSAYTSLAPVRILDTRITASPLGPGQTLSLQVAGVGSVPASATSVALNVTVTGTTAASFLSVYPAGESRPIASNLNWVGGETRANLVVVPVGSGGSVSFYNHSGQTEVVADLQGYFSPPATAGAGEYVPLSPSRIADTRPGSGEPYAGDTLGPGQTLDVQVTGMGGVPTSGVAAADVNVTVTDTTAASFLTVYPSGQTTPLASNLNWTPGLTIANRVMVPVGSGGKISIYNQSGQVDVVVDVDGYYSSTGTTASGASLYYPVSPTRVLDTRVDGGTLQGGSDLAEQFAGLSGVGVGASAIVANLTATDTSTSSFFTLSPTDGAPTTSDLNWGAEMTVPGLAITALSTNGDAFLYNHAGSAQAVIDVFGYFQPTATTATTAGPDPCTTAGLSAPSQDYVGTGLTVTAQGSCPSGSTPYYTYWYRAPGTSVWTLGQGATTSNTYSYPTSSWVVGSYELLAWVSSQSGVYQQLTALATTQLLLPPCTGVSVSVSPNPGLVSAPVVVTAAPQCPAIDTPHYAFFAGPAGGSSPKLLQGWTTNPSLLVGTQGWASGQYSFTVWISNVGTGVGQASGAVQDDLAGSGSILVSNVPYSPQYYSMDCEEASLEMALAHDGILLQGNNVQSQNDILGAEGVDLNVPGIGPSYTSGDPMVNFIGPPNGPESSTYEPGAYYGAVVKAAVHFGAQILAAGEGVSVTQVLRYVEQGHPVQTWVTFNFQHYNPVYLTNGRNTWPWVGPHEHSVMVVGIGVNEVLIDNPWPTYDYGAAYAGADQWVPISVFEGAYSSFGNMAVVLK